MKPTFSTEEVIQIAKNLETIHEFTLLANIVIEEKKRYSLFDLDDMAVAINRKFKIMQTARVK